MRTSRGIYQVFWIAQNYLELDHWLYPEENLYDIVDSALEEFWMVSTLETFTRDMQVLMKELALPEISERKNVGGGVRFKKLVSLTDDLRARLRAENATEYRLYDKWLARARIVTFKRNASREKFVPAWLRPFAAILAIFVIAAAFTSVNLEVSRKVGRLSTVPNYDDVVYLNLASTIYFTGKRRAWAPRLPCCLARSCMRHSRSSMVCGFRAFRHRCGPHLSHAYACGFCVPALHCGDHAWSAASLRVALVLGSLAIPFATMCALEFRPDLMWATVLGEVACFFLERRIHFENGDRLCFTELRSSGAADQAIHLCNEPPRPGGVWFLVALREKLCGHAGWRQILAGWLLTIFASVAFAGGNVLPHGSEILGYFYSNSFGENKDVWIYKAGYSIGGRITYVARLFNRTLDISFFRCWAFIFGARFAIFGRAPDSKRGCAGDRSSGCWSVFSGSTPCSQ